MIRRAMAFCLFLLALLFASCQASSSSSSVGSAAIASDDNSSGITEAVVPTFSLPYFSSDSLNPYSAVQSTNFYLGSLLYDSLVSVDSAFSVTPVLAETMVHAGTRWTITLRQGLRFSDGSALTAADVVSSYNAARSCGLYAPRLSNVVSCSAKDNVTINFVLQQPDRLFDRNLTFPIVKGGSKASRAVGSGRYCFSPEEKPLSLIQNEYCVRKSSEIRRINLVEVHRYSLLPYMTRIGSVNFVYTSLSDSQLKAASAKTAAVLQNDLVYIGVNSSHALLANQDFRKAISLCADRAGILTDAFAGRGSSTAQPFHPKNESLSSADYTVDLFDSAAAQQLFALAGLSQKNEAGVFLDAAGNPVTLRLLVNRDNSARLRAAQGLVQRLTAAGIGVELSETDDATYNAQVAAHHYDLFIGEVKLTPSNDISRLLQPGALNACNDGGETLTAYRQFLSEEMSLSDFLRIFDVKTPFIPLLYKNATAIYSGTLRNVGDVCDWEIFAGIDAWKF